MAVLLLDLDNTLADREGAFRTWAHRKASEWAAITLVQAAAARGS